MSYGRALVPAGPRADGRGCAGVSVVVGACFISLAVLFAGLRQFSIFEVANLALGSILLFLGFIRLWAHRGLGSPEAVLIPDSIRLGAPFLIRYRQRMGRELTVNLAASLVLRERVPGEGEGETEWNRDYLVRSHHERRVIVPKGGTIERDFAFEVPFRGIAGVDGSTELQWIFKVRFEAGPGGAIWQEFVVPVDVATQALTRTAPLPPSRNYSVVLVEGGGRGVTEALRELLPHLDDDQLRKMYSSRPVVIREHASLQEAEDVHRRLAAAGASVEVHHGSTISEREAIHKLPLPHSAPPTVQENLPGASGPGEDAAADRGKSSE